MPIQCPRCQMINRDSAQFCNSCGVSLVAQTSSSLPSNSKQTPSSQLSDLKPKKPSPQEKLTFTRISAAPPLQSTKFPRINAGPGFGAWLIFFLIFLIVHIGLYAILSESIGGDYEAFETFLLQGFFIFMIGSFIFQIITKAKVFTGLVTHIEPFYDQNKKRVLKSTPNLEFYLQRTNRQWKPLKDKQGFLKPILEIAYRNNIVHGAALDEGAQVILKAKKKRDHYHAKVIWNLSAITEDAKQSPFRHHWGRVIHNAFPRHLPDMRYPGQNKVIEVWSFRLQPTDRSFNQLSRDLQGDLLVPIPIEIRARAISGPLQEGDKVEIKGQMVNGTLYVSRLINHSAGVASLVIKEPADIPQKNPS